MRQSVFQAHTVKQLRGTVYGIAMFRPRYQRWHRHVFDKRKLRQELMVLKDKTDIAVAEG